MLKGILVGLDGSPESDAAVELGLIWAKRYEARLVGLGIVDEPTITSPTVVPIGAGQLNAERNAKLLADARSRVEAFIARFDERCARAGVDHSTSVRVGAPFEQIALEAQRCDLVLLGKQTHFHFVMQEGPCDTLSKVLHLSPRPVIVAPASTSQGANVVAAYDGSLQAAKALQALQITGLDRLGEVHLVCVADHEDAETHARRAVDFLALHGIGATVHLLKPTGPLEDQLLAEATRLCAGLIVMGAYGQAYFREFVLGSVTRSLLKRAAAPLLLAH